ncbi:MAG: DUF192 domain-containing protein [bacterium]|nr:DUF192 domain-containing protein [bacterium]
MVKYFVLILLILLLVAGTRSSPVIKLEDREVSLIIADTDLERVRGLGGRRSLPENTAMLFVFDTLGPHGIWMKGMEFPIDILWIDGEKKITHIEKNISPDTYPKVFSAEEESLYILEANAGFSDKNNLMPGDKLNFLLSK